MKTKMATFLFILVCGVFIPHIAGLLCMELTPPNFLFISYIYYSIMFFILWKGNSYILYKIGNRFNWTKEPLRKLVVLLFSYIIFTGIIAFTFTITWYEFVVRININWSYVFNMIMILIISVLFISHIHETITLISQTIREKHHNDQIELSMIKSELNALKAQIDPHFMFNSLNTLGFLIDHDKEKATSFNQNLAELFQYILSNKNKGLVYLKNEIEIAQKYFMLMKIRFGDDIKLIINPNVIEYYNFSLPSISLQIVIENAIKHNKFNNTDNLIIQIYVINDVLIISNRVNKIQYKRNSNGIGLMNLNKRYELLTGKNIEYIEEDNQYLVKIPLLKYNIHENSNS